MGFFVLVIVGLYPVVLLLGFWSELWQRQHYKEISWRQALAEVKQRRRNIFWKLTGIYIVFMVSSLIYSFYHHKTN